MKSKKRISNSEKETIYLSSSKTNYERLLAAITRDKAGIYEIYGLEEDLKF
jgi:PHD/YefM family antitoxin component YafN of YafNO toxin-antitoxin module